MVLYYCFHVCSRTLLHLETDFDVFRYENSEAKEDCNLTSALSSSSAWQCMQPGRCHGDKKTNLHDNLINHVHELEICALELLITSVT